MAGFTKKTMPGVGEAPIVPVVEPRREDPAALAQKLQRGVVNLPTTTPQPPPAAQREETLQVNFRASKSFARLLHKLQKDAGSIGVRCWLARKLHAEGYPIPEEDLHPKFVRRVWED